MSAMCRAHTTLCPVTRKYLMKGKHTKGEMPAAQQAPSSLMQQAIVLPRQQTTECCPGSRPLSVAQAADH